MGAEGTLKLWEVNHSETETEAETETESNVVEQTGEILFGKNLQEAFSITYIGLSYLMVAVGGYDSKIHCYTCLRK